jgi:adenine-specific DNA-methyltransferase
MQRKIRKFNELNWFQWGAPRNISSIRARMGDPCIYVHNLTRKSQVAFVDKVRYFGGNLIMLLPKNDMALGKVADYINSDSFKRQFTYSGRFKIGQRHLVNAALPA